MMLIKKIAQKTEAAALAFILKLAQKLPPPTASQVGGEIFSKVGPYLPYSKIAQRNLANAYPQSSVQFRQAVIAQMWRNLGQNFGEFPHLGSLRPTSSGTGYEVVNEDILKKYAHIEKPVIFISGHIGNWELMPMVNARYGCEFATLYRRSNNSYIDQLIQYYRQQNLFPYSPPYFPKGAYGGRQAFQWVDHKGRLGLLTDQKLNQGIKSIFFGQPAMTAPTAAILTLKYHCPLILGYTQRLYPARLRFILKKIDVPSYKCDAGNIRLLTQKINNVLEEVIRKDPSSWLWIHNRWKKQ